MSSIPRGSAPGLFIRREYEISSIPIVITADSTEWLDMWTGNRSVLFEGVRGSGKTSILRALEWDVALGFSETPVEYPEGFTPLSAESNLLYFGVNFRAEEIDRKHWDEWCFVNGESAAQKVFAAYIEFSLLSLFLKALNEIMDRKPEFFSDWKDENKLVENILDKSFPNEPLRPPLRINSVYELQKVISQVTFKIRDLVCREIRKDSLFKSIPLPSPGALVSLFGSELTKTYSFFSKSLIFPMIDDCNHIKDWQKEVINSALSRTKSPVFYKLTTVSGLYDHTDTMDKRPVNVHELTRIQISPTDSSKFMLNFGKRINKICKSRISYFIRNEFVDDFVDEFDLKWILGEYNLKEELEVMIRSSEKKETIKFISSLDRMRNSDQNRISIFDFWRDDRKCSSSEVKEVNAESKEERKKLLRSWDSAQGRKKNYSMTTDICSHFSIPYPYSGYKTILHLSSNSIREALRILFCIWNEEDFISSDRKRFKKVPATSQQKGIRAASEEFFRAVLTTKPLFNVTTEQKGVHYDGLIATSPQSICNRLGSLIQKLQCFPYADNAETGSLKVRKSELNVDINDALEYLLMSGGVLKNPEDDEDHRTIGLHPILAPTFNISFRSPFYYSISVKGSCFVQLISGNDNEAKKAAEEILNAIISKKEQQPVPIQQKLF